ncbi:hypothetical protein AB1484_38940 [Parafrankia sp. FMc6]|uniref:hypothetical protein n=1 Tax=Parafrankia soli TaxID=2599596 RepID=UPI0034D65493
MVRESTAAQTAAFGELLGRTLGDVTLLVTGRVNNQSWSGAAPLDDAEIDRLVAGRVRVFLRAYGRQASTGSAWRPRRQLGRRSPFLYGGGGRLPR